MNKAEDQIARELPAHLVMAIEELITKSQLFGSASGRKAPLAECEARMSQVKLQKAAVYALLKATLSSRYEAGIELGRQQAQS